MSFQGRLSTVGGPSANLVVRLWPAATGGTTPLLAETFNNVPLTDGVFSIMVGSMGGGVPDAALEAPELWLGLSVNGAAELTPRTRIGMVPFAAKTRSSEELVRPGTCTTAAMVDAAGDLGIGTVIPAADLHLLRTSAGGGITELRIEHIDSPLNPLGDAVGSLRLVGMNEFLTGQDSVSTLELRASSFFDLGAINAVEPGMELSFQLQGAERMRVDTAGIGIGIASPDSALHVARGTAGAVSANANSIATLESDGAAYLSILTPINSERGILFGEPTSPEAGGIIYNNVNLADGMQFRTNGNITRMSLDREGRLGLGVASATHAFDLNGAARLRGNASTNLLITGSGDDMLMDFVKNSNTTPAARIQFNGYSNQAQHQGSIQFFTRGSADAGVVERARINENGQLDVFGRTATCTLQITAGCDVSEQFDVAPAAAVVAEPGMVVCIDAKNPGRLIVSSKPNDRSVAGIISGAGGIGTGMILSQPGELTDGEHPVALTGRVWTHCDAGPGAIEPGDLLTTSATAGHAMKADAAASQGAIIGKAMTRLESGRGLVLVLVNLQ